MSLTGNGSKSIRRQDVLDQKSIAVGLKKLVMAHKATAGDTGINLGALVSPTEMSTLGFVNPSAQEILAANLKFYRSNLRVVSSHKGLLMDYLSYNVASSSRINFTDFTAEADEIFVITFDDNAKTGITMVDSEPIIATGPLAVGATDFNTGVPYEVGINSTSKQVGKVLVFRNGDIQFRNPSNGTSGGNYQEIAAGLGLGVIIRFNNAPVGQEDNIIVVGLGTAYRPDGSVFAEIENLAGQVDRVVEVLSDVSGLDEDEFQTAPNSVDLKAFGDRVLALEALAAENLSALRQYTLSVSGTNTWVTERAVGIPYRTLDGTWRLRFNISGSHTSATTTSLTVSGVVFKTLPGPTTRQACHANDNSGGSAPSNNFCQGGSSTISINHASANTQNTVFGDVELDGQPSFVP